MLSLWKEFFLWINYFIKEFSNQIFIKKFYTSKMQIWIAERRIDKKGDSHYNYGVTFNLWNRHNSLG